MYNTCQGVLEPLTVIEPLAVIEPGDRLVTRCIYDSRSSDKVLGFRVSGLGFRV
jgi:hypothetical protein